MRATVIDALWLYAPRRSESAWPDGVERSLVHSAQASGRGEERYDRDVIAGIGDVAIGPLVGATVAALGYVAKISLEYLAGRRKLRRERAAELARLQALLDASRAAYLSQRELRDRLNELLQASHSEYVESRGDDWNFRVCYPTMSSEEIALHVIIRSYTEHAIRPLNEDTVQWLARDTFFRAGRSYGAEGERLAGMLTVLHAHLLLWAAKYAVWIPERPENALVFLADEESHGIGFPRGIEAVIATVSAQLANRSSL